MTFFEAALRVLKEAEGSPLHYKEIARRALGQGYIETTGLTPEATVGAQLYAHIRKSEKASRDPQVKQVGKGIFTLTAKTKYGLEKDVDEWNEYVRRELLAAVMQIEPRAFEILVGALLTNIGFENVVVTKYSGDGGLDVEAELTVGGITSVKTAVQAKRWQKKVNGRVVRELRGGQKADQRGLIITTSDFTPDAKTEATAPGKTPISLVNGKQLVDLLIENDVGVSKRSLLYLTLEPGQLEEFSDGSSTTDQGKFNALWPLPGGTNHYVATATEMLKYIARAEPTREQMRKWTKTNYKNVQSDSSVDGYIGVLRTLSLASYDGERLTISADGSEVIAGDSTTLLGNQLCKRISGIEELLEFIDSKEITRSDAQKFFGEELGFNWETKAQVEYRLRWLVNTGLLVLEDGRYHLSI